MKVTLYCAHCLLERAVNQVKLATDDENTRLEVTTVMLQFLADNFNDESVPSHIGTDRDLIVQEMTGKDPYAELKQISNQMALSILPELKALVDEAPNEDDRFRRAALIAAAANAIEFDVSGREFSLDDLRAILESVESDLVIDQVSEFMNLCRSVDEVTYLMDNSGEIVLDMILIGELRRIGPRVVAVVKGGPVLNDATMIDAEEVGLMECADEVRHTGASAIGVNLERVSGEFKELFQKSQLIVAKGMGNYESLTELEPTAPVVHILRTKCSPVADHIGVARDKNVILIRYPKSG
ncbi:MAG: DUF89 family protein [Candidatus Thorarchaeota archaeon]|nr:MAG: DUF89 family protein [Candidatus Thorarchaeota archaeon]